ncbi:IS3 family transposase [Prauserella shujinwangii]
MENFFSTLKIELVSRDSWRTRDGAENVIFSYIGSWYNTPAHHPRVPNRIQVTNPPSITPRETPLSAGLVGENRGP